MQCTISINQAEALEWGINSQQAILLAFIREISRSHSNRTISLGKHDIVRELPLLTDKPDTAYRLLKQLESAGILELENQPATTVVRFTDKYWREAKE